MKILSTPKHLNKELPKEGVLSPLLDIIYVYYVFNNSDINVKN